MLLQILNELVLKNKNIMVPEFKKLMHKRASKGHYDHKKPIKLMFKDGLIVTEKTHEKSQQSYHQGMSIQSHAFDYSHEAFEADGDHEPDEHINFDETNEDQNEMVMAKAYDLSSEDTYVMAKAYDEDEDDNHPSTDLNEEPVDQNNPYSDVFQVDDHLFEEENANSRNESDTEDEDVDDQFARDLHAVLSGQKSLAQLAEYADESNSKDEETKPTNDKSVQHVEDKMDKDEAIFEQLAVDMNRLQTFQLGEVQLEEIFDSADADLLKENAQRQKLEEVVTEAAMSLDGMEMAEDFEYMDSLAESDSDNSASAETNENYEDANVIVDEVETNESVES